MYSSAHQRLERGSRPGFVFLLGILVIGIIVTEMAMSLILLGIAAEQSGQTIAQSAQSLAYAHACAERALLNLRQDLSYDGGETATFGHGTCVIRHTGGSGNANRAVCVEGRSGRSTRRVEISVRQVYPRVTIPAWREVSTFTLCP